MKTNKLVDIISTIFLFIGMFLAFLPHALHLKAGLDEDTSHLKHVITGIIIVLLGLGILIWNNKALNFKNKQHVN